MTTTTEKPFDHISAALTGPNLGAACVVLEVEGVDAQLWVDDADWHSPGEVTVYAGLWRGGHVSVKFYRDDDGVTWRDDEGRILDFGTYEERR